MKGSDELVTGKDNDIDIAFRKQLSGRNEYPVVFFIAEAVDQSSALEGFSEGEIG